MEEEKILTLAVLVLLRRNNEVLLARKTRKIGKGCWNGYGGGVEKGETVRAAAVRELSQETGGLPVEEEDLEQVAVIHFHNTRSDGGTHITEMHVFVTDTWSGQVHATDEMATPTWFVVDEVPYDELMPSDRDWMPLVLADKKIVAHAYLGPFQKEKQGTTTIEEVVSFT